MDWISTCRWAPAWPATDCDLTKDSASVTAAWLTAAGWVLRLLAWVFAALFIAGFTSAVRKT